MNWEQILTEHTTKIDDRYVQTKEINQKLLDEMTSAARDWTVCAVGSFLSDRIDRWAWEDNDRQANALDILQDKTGIPLVKQGNDFFECIYEDNIAAARKCYEDIKITVNGMDQADLTLLDDNLHSDDCDCDECVEYRDDCEEDEDDDEYEDEE